MAYADHLDPPWVRHLAGWGMANAGREPRRWPTRRLKNLSNVAVMRTTRPSFG